MHIKITDTSGVVHFISIEKTQCVMIDGTTISFCNSAVATDRFSFTRGFNLSNGDYDNLLNWVNNNISYIAIN